MIRKIIEATYLLPQPVSLSASAQGVTGGHSVQRGSGPAHLDDGGFRHSGSSTSLIIRLRQVSQCRFKP
jgi:hypothetical protein